MSELVPPRVQQDASLAFDPSQQGKSAEEINDAIDALHLGPSWGTEYKVKPYIKGEVAAGAGAVYYYDTSIDPYQISANRGETLAVGGRISGQIGIQFGPYSPGTIDSERNSSISLGLGSFLAKSLMEKMVLVSEWYLHGDGAAFQPMLPVKK
ncbi:hypothetical protein FS593_00290 [Lelliottia amnigena]|nr:polymorphic toxin type 25 domain-containing protein [Lelliottia amnigena]UJD92832.1 hypothetical protein FS593_00290 [Lelliottia amnigena]